jgi:pimeloyl-ACP methyl ester carboxylesterase
MKKIMFYLLLVLAVFALFIVIWFQIDQNAALARVQAGSHLLNTPTGQIEYGESGAGQDVLVLHGAGGGYDQALLMGQTLLGPNYHLIAPSRFGYLNSPIPADSSLEAQVEAYITLLDTLKIQKVDVVAISAGGPTGLLFAMHHPERTRSLVMVSAVSYTEPRSGQARSNIESSVNRVIGSDFVYWVFYKFIPQDFLALVGVPKQAQQKASPQDQQFAHTLLEYMQPMSQRFPGILLDQTRELPKDRPLDIRVPVLVVHAKDDTLVPFPNGQFSAERISGAQFMPLESGGHFLLGSYQQVKATATTFLNQAYTASH